MLHQVQSDCRHKCCAQVLRPCANMYCLPFCAHYNETRTRRTSHVCAHRTLRQVPLNTRYTFKQLSEFNSVGLNCSYVAMCMCRCRRDRTKRTSHARIERFNEYLWTLDILLNSRACSMVSSTFEHSIYFETVERFVVTCTASSHLHVVHICT